MKKIELSQLSCKYGAPMGRSETHARGDYKLPFKFQMQRLRFIDGCYDQGGAYWGSPANVYVVRCEDPEGEDVMIQFYVRGDTRAEAKANVRTLYPNARFYN